MSAAKRLNMNRHSAENLIINIKSEDILYKII